MSKHSEPYINSWITLPTLLHSLSQSYRNLVTSWAEIQASLTAGEKFSHVSNLHRITRQTERRLWQRKHWPVMFQVVTSGNPTPTWPKKEKVLPAWIEKQATIVRLMRPLSSDSPGMLVVLCQGGFDVRNRSPLSASQIMLSLLTYFTVYVCQDTRR